MSIGFLTDDFSPSGGAYVPNGAAYYRSYLPMLTLDTDCLMGRPAWTGATGFGIKTAQDKAVFRFSTVSLKLMMERWVPHQTRVARSLGQRVVVDVDDFYKGLESTNLAFEVTDPRKNKRRNRAYYEDAILAADTVTVTTPFLLEHYSALHPDVRMVRNGVRLGDFTKRKVRDRRPVIGWMGGIDWRSGDLELLKEWLPDFLDDHDLLFHHSGHVPGRASFAEVVGIRPERFSCSPMVPIDRISELMTFDIGLVPLTDVPFNHAKSCLKGLEYAASGIPFVASALPEYEYLHDTGVGRLAKTPWDWSSHLLHLLDPAERNRDAVTNYRVVEKQHTYLARADEWRSVYEGSVLR